MFLGTSHQIATTRKLYQTMTYLSIQLQIKVLSVLISTN